MLMNMAARVATVAGRFSGTPDPTDADLVAASRRGDRDAFGQIVRRYQGAVSGVIYAGCGDLDRSEDLAQEAFLSAWKSLSGLREPERLGGWLCQIARRRAADFARAAARERDRIAAVVRTRGGDVDRAEPAGEAIVEEEKQVMWRALGEVAEPYRETLVLYYRQGKSTTDVARVMEISEDLVRQRLARGREMLREQVAAMLERNLARTTPADAFAASVVAALPALQAAGVKAAAAGAAAGKGGLTTAVGMWIGPALGLAGGVWGSVGTIRSARTPRERRFVWGFVIALWALVILGTAGIMVTSLVGPRLGWTARTGMLIYIAAWAAYGLAVTSLVMAVKQRHARLRAEEGLAEIVPATVPEATRRVLMVVVPPVATLSWMVAMAGQAGDRVGMAVAAAGMAAAVAVAFAWVRRHGMTNTRPFALAYATALGAFTFVMVNWRMYAWIAFTAKAASEAMLREKFPRWELNLLLAVVWGAILGWTTVSLGGGKKVATPAAEPPV